MVKQLKGIGLTDQASGFLLPELPEEEEDDGSPMDFHDLIEWLKDHRQKLKEIGFHADELKIDGKRISTAPIRIEHKVRYDNDWFDLKAVVRIGHFSFSFLDFKEYLLNDIREFRLPNGKIAILPREWFVKYKTLFQFGKSAVGGLKIAKSQAGLLKSIDKIPKKVREKVEAFTLDTDREKIGAPEGFRAELRPYQVDGLNWMEHLWQHELGGCLADDMGLGKTVQTLALLLHIKRSQKERKTREMAMHGNGDEDQGDSSLDIFDTHEAEKNSEQRLNSLIVMPSSLVHNWEQEIRKFTPDLTVYSHTGVKRTQDPEDLFQYDITLTTYSTLRNDIDLLREFDFNYLILDESQFIKNPSSKTFKALKKVNAKGKLVLTGTPIENSLSDLWSQMSVVSPGILGNYNFFRDQFIVPIEQKGNEAKRNQLKKIIAPFVKRRTKYEVAKDLPPLTEKVFYSEMSEEQKEIYEAEKSRARNTIFESIDKYGRKQATNC